MKNLKGQKSVSITNEYTQTQKSFTKGEFVKKEKGITLVALVVTKLVPVA